MPTILNEVELRVLVALVEKQVTTPEYYPLTLNALTLACNQKNNRHPVTAYDETTVGLALESLREKNLTYVFYGSTSRVPKYKHVMPEIFHLSAAELALMCALVLRGPQTVGELRGNAGRLFDFVSLEEVEQTLQALITKEPDPLVVRLPRQPGQKEARFAHLLGGDIDVENLPAEEETPRAAATLSKHDAAERITRLEQQVASLQTEMAGLREQFDQFKKQFD